MTAITKHEGGAITTGTGGPMEAMIALAQQGVSTEVMERMLAMQERILARDARMAFVEALAAFQAAVGPVPKISKGAIRNDGSKTTTVMYAARDVIMDHIRKPLAAHGLSVRYEIANADENTKVTCIVSHILGHEERTTFETKTSNAAPPRASGVQISGSAVEYGMRYSLVAGLGLVAQGVDDDGETAGRAPSEPITEGQAADLRSLAEEVGADVPRFLKFLGVPAFGDIPAARLAEATALLESKRKGGA
jgi:hypothetical protein